MVLQRPDNRCHGSRNDLVGGAYNTSVDKQCYLVATVQGTNTPISVLHKDYLLLVETCRIRFQS
jgi:hypothetical protein